MTRLRRIGEALLAALALFVAGVIITLDLVWRAATGKEGL
jgi:hypothetical protein